MTIGMEIELLYDFTIAGKVKNLSLSTTSLKTYFQTPVKVKDLDTKISAMEQPLIALLNT